MPGPRLVEKCDALLLTKQHNNLTIMSIGDRHGQEEKKMAITKTEIADKIETLEDGQVQIRTATIIKEDDTELTRTFHRHVLAPSTKTDDTWGDTDISDEDARVQAICNAVWTSAVKTAYQVAQDAAAPE